MIGLLAALALQAAGAAPAAAGAAAPVQGVVVQPAKAQKGGNKDELICKSENPMGSKIPVKKCYNKQEYQQRRLEERRALDRIQADARAPRGG